MAETATETITRPGDRYVLSVPLDRDTEASLRAAANAADRSISAQARFLMKRQLAADFNGEITQ